MAYLAKLLALNNDISLYGSKSAFESSTLSINEAIANSTAFPHNQATSSSPIDDILSKKITNPLQINDEIEYYKQYLSKLKFLYLEQETRDKFLRRILIDKQLDITNEEIAAITEENKVLKADLKQLKQEIDTFVGRIDGITDETIESNETYNQKLTEVNTLTTDIDQMNTQLNAIINEIENNEDNLLLFNLQKSVGNFQVLNFDKILEISNNQLSSNISQYQALTKQIDDSFVKHNEKITIISELNAGLQSLIDSGSSVPETNNATQLWAHLINQLNQVLETFFSESITLVRLGDNYQLQLENYKVVLKSDLTIVNVVPSGPKQARLVADINSSDLSRWDRFLSLLTLLAEL